MPLLKDAHPTIAEILDGKHDSLLAAFRQACDVREKKVRAASGIRKNAEIRMAAGAGKVAGRTGAVKSVNAKSVTVILDCPTCGKRGEGMTDAEAEAMTQEELRESFSSRCETCWGGAEEWRVSPNLIEVVEAVTA
jgi:hypothetical protein